MNLGRIAIVAKGPFNPAVPYKKLDLVEYQGSSFIALQDLQPGITPTPANSTSWMLAAKRGENFKFEDLTPENIVVLQAPLQEVIEEANQAIDVANEASKNALIGIKGVATTSTVPSATGFERWLVHEAGTYTNFSGIVVTSADLDVVSGVANNRVILEVSEGVATKRVERIKGEGLDAYETAVKNGFTGTYIDWINSLKGTNGINASAHIPDYSELVFPLSAGSSYFYNGKIYQVKSGQTLLQTDAPAGEKVTLRLSQTVNNITQYVADPSQVFQADLMYNDVFDI